VDHVKCSPKTASQHSCAFFPTRTVHCARLAYVYSNDFLTQSSLTVLSSCVFGGLTMTMNSAWPNMLAGICRDMWELSAWLPPILLGSINNLTNPTFSRNPLSLILKLEIYSSHDTGKDCKKKISNTKALLLRFRKSYDHSRNDKRNSDSNK